MYIQQVVKTGSWRKNIWAVQRENIPTGGQYKFLDGTLIAPSGITTLADRWFNLMSSF